MYQIKADFDANILQEFQPHNQRNDVNVVIHLQENLSKSWQVMMWWKQIPQQFSLPVSRFGSIMEPASTDLHCYLQDSALLSRCHVSHIQLTKNKTKKGNTQCQWKKRIKQPSEKKIKSTFKILVSPTACTLKIW